MAALARCTGSRAGDGSLVVLSPQGCDPEVASVAICTRARAVSEPPTCQTSELIASVQLKPAIVGVGVFIGGRSI